MGMIQKQENWVLYELKPRNVERRFFTCEQLIQKQQRKGFFCIGLWLEMRSGYSTTTPRRKNTMLSPVNSCHRPQHQHHGRTFMIRRSCSVSGETKRILFTMSCWNLAIPLRAIGIGYNWFVWAALREKRPEYEQRHDKVIFLLTTLGLSQKSYKNIWKCSNGILPHPPYSPDIVPSDYWLFWRMQQVTGSLLLQKSKIGSKIGSPPKSRFFEMEFENCLRDGKK